MKIGMIGVQSGHFDFFTEQINLEKRFPGVEVTAVWGGDAPEKLTGAANDYGIPFICQTPDQLFEQCDTVFVLQRDGHRHMEYARAAQKRGKALFVDKPFAMTFEDAAELINNASQASLPLTGGSTLCHLPAIAAIRQTDLTSANTIIAYHSDPDSPYGGWAYYGSHLCDLCSCICGPGARSVLAQRDGDSVTVMVSYGNKQVILHTDKERKFPEIVVSHQGYTVYGLDDQLCFRYGLEHFIGELGSYSTQAHSGLGFSALLLEASLKSLQTGRLIDLNLMLDQRGGMTAFPWLFPQQDADW